MARGKQVHSGPYPGFSMKIPRRFNPLPNAALCRVLIPALALGGAVSPAFGDAKDKPPVVMEPVVVGEAKTHTLFMGADISVNLDKSLYPVRNVIGSSWVIVINGKDEVVSAKRAPLSLKITPTLKLTEISAKIEGFKRVPAYSYNNDPSVMLTRGLSQAASINADLLAVSANAQHLADTVGNAALGPSASFATADNQFGDKALLYGAMTLPAVTHPGKAIPGSAQPAPSGASNTSFNGLSAQQVMQQVDNAVARAALSQTENASEPAGRLTTMGFDAIDIDFTVSAVRTLFAPYVVTMTRFRTPDSKPGMVQTLVYAQALDPIYPHATNVHFTEEGFPFNYELIDFQLHLYDRGQEIATNISSKRVELTRDEAFEYVKMEYIGSHRDETLPAVPAMGRLPAELPTRLAAGKYNETFFTKVTKDGLADEAYVDGECATKVNDPFLNTVVRSIRFKPALAHGKPVDGIASLDLSKLQI